MVKKVFSVYDNKAEAFLQPFFADTTGVALRSIGDAIADSSHPFGKYTADFTLFCLGTFNDSTGALVEDKQSLGCLIEFKKPSNVVPMTKES